ncbi:MAG: hypothetical protein A2186_04410 [Candidatus Levybacteria bacterium RIFOXYA1_FULL_41_10]|nr:MAG: hypothetical protein A3H20_01155 [Candidatus Levybacteria bacterium RIFCSPLOWO2_12_FULL_41_12]OGH52660.1 MAG: hypothetical protein A2423_02650 [Candidatus Levybacteria bacterium RIFOXYC1_FULL_40_10]OGH54618.1 MAG: hypothetical protein A2596_00265 [Candidatus Levybacteria bacterium RIFOXYD1_FULL_40_21]OGH56934.1 MAG: hypothetical protein A2186_04410 [Candidatus Levybacteria bacterium RIFOXYA1_FULL_41_10]OGH70658.1 MAG: hypothetical protein A2396_03770 [Candidatus Levybacteria bacterium R
MAESIEKLYQKRGSNLTSALFCVLNKVMASPFEKGPPHHSASDIAAMSKEQFQRFTRGFDRRERRLDIRENGPGPDLRYPLQRTRESVRRSSSRPNQ